MIGTQNRIVRIGRIRDGIVVTTRELIESYNWFAAQYGKEAIDTEGNEARTPGRVEQLLHEWVGLARAKALAANGRIFEARVEALSLLQQK